MVFMGITLKDARELSVIYFKLEFDYYIIAEQQFSTLYPEFL